MSLLPSHWHYSMYNLSYVREMRKDAAKMSEKQFEDYRHRKQDVSEKKTEKSQDDKQNLAEECNKRRIYEGKSKKQPINTKNNVNEYMGAQPDQKDIVDRYMGEQQDQEEPEDLWP